MHTSIKIHLLLAFACIGLFLTAILAHQAYTPQYNLGFAGRGIENHLHQKELVVAGLLDKNTVEFFKNLRKDDKNAFELIQELAHEGNISFVTYENNKPVFWSSNLIVPENSSKYQNGRSFLKEPNGYFEVFKKTEGSFSILFFIQVKQLFPYANQYLHNSFVKNLTADKNIEITSANAPNSYQIASIDHSYLFSITFSRQEDNLFSVMQIILWLGGFILLAILAQRLCIWIANKGHVAYSFLLLAGIIVLVRYVNLFLHWPNASANLTIFSPYIYGSNSVFPSLGDLVLNVICITWFSTYVYTYRYKILRPIIDKTKSLLVWILAICLFIFASVFFLKLFESLIINSTINFNITYIIDVDPFRIIGLLMVCLGFLCFYNFSETFLALSLSINIYQRHKLWLFLLGLLMATLVHSFYYGFTVYYLLWGTIVILLGYNNFYKQGKLSPQLIISITLIAATICAMKLFEFQDFKEKETRKLLLQQLESSDDPNAIAVFKNIEHKIITDSAVINFYTDTAHNASYLSNHLQKAYFDIDLSRYDFKVYAFNKHDQKMGAESTYDLNTFKSLVIYGAFKVSDFFYRVNDSFGVQYYFALLPIRLDGNNLGSLVIEFKSKPRESRSYFPDLLVASPRKSSNDLKDYSYAFYVDNKLVLQSGKYTYNLVNNKFNGVLKDYGFTMTSAGMFSAQYNHLFYKPTERKLLVVSKEAPTFLNRISALSFFFTVFLVFALIALAIRWLSAQHINFRFRNLKWNILLGSNRLLYKTRIQISMVTTVVIALVIVGLITFFSISNQYQSQKDEEMQRKIYQIADTFHDGLLEKGALEGSKESQLLFNSVADNYAVDLTLFDIHGKLVLTNQPKLLEYGLISRRMNALAYFVLNRFKQSKFVNEESIGDLEFKATYIPIGDANKNIVAYLQLPYFSNKADYSAWIGEFFNTMINVYAFVFVAIGLFAVFVANQITSPLTMIQHSLSNIQYGHKNEPIRWRRNDEIGSLIKEYNNMIAALEESANRLAQSERELAWREMAKQVAHEIKNPLTPLKLGLQLLEKSWKDQDPKFDHKFAKFSKSFIEQIESLSTIATEFSNFAKMPETHIEKVNLFELINKSVNVFKQLGEIEIIYEPSPSVFWINADRDQIMRCFNNLLKNAVESVPPDRKKVVKISYEISITEIHLFIEDNGIGIPEALQGRIFEPNFTTKSSGTGLGLAFVKNSIQNAGGQVKFRTFFNKGTIFHINLPRSM